MTMTYCTSIPPCWWNLLLFALLCANPSFVTAQECFTKGDCPTGSYCNALGACLEIGSCAGLADCSDSANAPFQVALCMGNMECTSEGKCEMNCSGSDALRACTSASDCPSDNIYCASDGVCRESGACSVAVDCSNTDNSFPMADCVGTMVCDNNMCGMVCDGSDAFGTCTSSANCTGFDEYCASDGVCRESGSCSAVDDCSNTDNSFPMAACVGTKTCKNNMCSMVCDGSDAFGTCTSSANCTGFDEYCASDGVCRESGSCSAVDDCSNVDNSFMMAACVGTKTCKNNMCGIVCDGDDGPPVPVTLQEPPATKPCKSSSDCDPDTEYCAQGTCLKDGKCKSDWDCKNPDHVFADVMCIGYQYCNDEGSCARECGIPCPPGQKEAECTTTGCDVDVSTCDGAVSCAPDYCNDCKGVFYDEAGSVIEECTEGDDSGGDPAVPALAATCTTDADCLSILPMKRAGDKSIGDEPMHYCAQGTCMDMGSCASDSDCTNPANMLYHDKRCAGYLTCVAGTGLCDRICGEMCKNGAKPVQCFADPCDVAAADACPESVSCTSNMCDGACEAVYFDAAGKIIQDCGAAPLSASGNNSKMGDVSSAGIDKESSTSGSTALSALTLSSVLLAASWIMLFC